MAPLYLGLVEGGIRVACQCLLWPFYSQSQGGRSIKHKGVISWDARGLVLKMQVDGFASEVGGIMEVAMCFAYHYYLGFEVVWGVVPNHVVLVLGNIVFILGNEGGGPHHMQGHHTQSLWIGLRKVVVLILHIHQMFNRGK